VPLNANRPGELFPDDFEISPDSARWLVAMRFGQASRR
jgi:hypothetical protein